MSNQSKFPYREQFPSANPDSVESFAEADVYTFDDQEVSIGKVIDYSVSEEPATITVLSNGQTYILERHLIWGVSTSRKVFLMLSSVGWDRFTKHSLTIPEKSE